MFTSDTAHGKKTSETRHYQIATCKGTRLGLDDGNSHRIPRYGETIQRTSGLCLFEYRTLKGAQLKPLMTENWLNTRAGRDFSMRTIPDLTKALNRLAEAMEGTDSKPDFDFLPEDMKVPTNQAPRQSLIWGSAGFDLGHLVNETKDMVLQYDDLDAYNDPHNSSRSYLMMICVLFHALSRMYSADNEDLDDARTMAFVALSWASWDFRNHLEAFIWDDEHINQNHKP